jgi:hypothetical protein
VLSEQLGDLEQCKVRKEKRLCSACSFSRLLKGTKRNETKRNETKRNETTIHQDRLGKNIRKDTTQKRCLLSLSPGGLRERRALCIRQPWLGSRVKLVRCVI